MNMRGRGWLDEKRVWRSSRLAFDQVVDLRPLHRRELPGFLGAELPGSASSGPLIVEFRDRDRWDAGIDEPIVLVHRFEANRSYVMHDAAGRDSLTKGQALQYGQANGLSQAFGRVDVLAIDVQNRTARVRLQHRAAVGIVADGPAALVGVADAARGGRALGDVARRHALETIVGWAKYELEQSNELTSPAAKCGGRAGDDTH